MKINCKTMVFGLMASLWTMAVQAGPPWVVEKGVNGESILEWFSTPEALAEWPRNLNAGTDGEAAGEAALDFLRHYEDRIPGWAESSAEKTIKRICQLENMLDVLVARGGYRNLALADMTARVVYVGLVRAMLSAREITPELEQQITRALQFEIPIEKWRKAVQEETGWTNAELEEREKLWSGQIQGVSASPSSQETRQINFYTLAYAATGGQSMKDESFSSIFRVLPDYYHSAKTCNLMIMYAKIEYLFRFSLPAALEYAKTDHGREHLDDNEWIRANVSVVRPAMLSTSNMGGVEEEIREVVRASSLKHGLEAHAGIVWASQSGELAVP